jgi:hypothetical protein
MSQAREAKLLLISKYKNVEDLRRRILELLSFDELNFETFIKRGFGERKNKLPAACDLIHKPIRVEFDSMAEEKGKKKSRKENDFCMQSKASEKNKNPSKLLSLLPDNETNCRC